MASTCSSSRALAGRRRARARRGGGVGRSSCSTGARGQVAGHGCRCWRARTADAFAHALDLACRAGPQVLPAKPGDLVKVFQPTPTWRRARALESDAAAYLRRLGRSTRCGARPGTTYPAMGDGPVLEEAGSGFPDPLRKHGMTAGRPGSAYPAGAGHLRSQPYGGDAAQGVRQPSGPGGRCGWVGDVRRRGCPAGGTGAVDGRAGPSAPSPGDLHRCRHDRAAGHGR